MMFAFEPVPKGDSNKLDNTIGTLRNRAGEHDSMLIRDHERACCSAVKVDARASIISSAVVHEGAVASTDGCRFPVLVQD